MRMSRPEINTIHDRSTDPASTYSGRRPPPARRPGGRRWSAAPAARSWAWRPGRSGPRRRLDRPSGRPPPRTGWSAPGAHAAAAAPAAVGAVQPLPPSRSPAAAAAAAGGGAGATATQPVAFAGACPCCIIWGDVYFYQWWDWVGPHVRIVDRIKSLHRGLPRTPRMSRLNEAPPSGRARSALVKRHPSGLIHEAGPLWGAQGVHRPATTFGAPRPNARVASMHMSTYTRVTAARERFPIPS